MTPTITKTKKDEKSVMNNKTVVDRVEMYKQAKIDFYCNHAEKETEEMLEKLGFSDLDQAKEALEHYYLGVSEIPVKHFEDFISDFGIKLSEDKKRFYPVNGYEITKENSSSNDGKKTDSSDKKYFMPVSRIKAFNYRLMRDQFFFKLKNLCEEKLIDYSVLEKKLISNGKYYGIVWDYIYKGEVTIKGKNEELKIVKTRIPVEEVINKYSYEVLGSIKNKISYKPESLIDKQNWQMI